MAKYSLKEISPQKIAFNPKNPRGESESDILHDESFEQLRDSVAQFGVLVPLVVHKAKHHGKDYILVDGERRLRAALETNTALVPAHVATSADKMDELIQAFHIHMLRKQWKPVAVARAFVRIKEALETKDSGRTERELLEDLQARTGCTNKQIEDLQRAIKYPASVLDEVAHGKILWSHLVQCEASFVEQIAEHYPDLLKKLAARKVREILVTKVRNGIIDKTRNLIDNILPVVRRAKGDAEKAYAGKLFAEFLDNGDMSPEEVKLRYDSRYPPSQDQIELADDIVKKCGLLKPMVDQIDTIQMPTFAVKAKELRKSLMDLQAAISAKLRKLNRALGY
jgi:ParB/RepB/Spo0J family partition protein